MCYTGESMLQAKSTMNDMEDLFKEMTEQLKMEGFDVLNHFMLTSNLVTDHMALAGGDSGSSLLTIEAPENTTEQQEPSHSKFKLIKKPLKIRSTTETLQEQKIPASKSIESIKKVEEQQREEVRLKIIAIQGEKASNRLYWSHMDEVRESGILSKMKKEEIHLQEGIFEILTSEASFNISLDIAIEFYYQSELLNPNREGSIINSVEKNHLFSNILLVKAVSLQFLKDLENRWSQMKPRVLDFADIILKHAADSEFQQQFSNYLANQAYQGRALRSLIQREAFKNAIETIQSNPRCCKLSLDSFLTLPMQRLTRLQLLIEVVLKLMVQSEELYKSIPESVIANHREALRILKELLHKTEEKKYENDLKTRLIDLSKMLDFGSNKAISIASKVLLKEGEIKSHIPQIFPNALKKLSKKKQPCFYLIVLSDLVIIAKKKSLQKINWSKEKSIEDMKKSKLVESLDEISFMHRRLSVSSLTKFMVLDYCDRDRVEATINNMQTLPPVTHKLSRERSIVSQVSTSFASPKDSTDNSASVAANQTFILKFGKKECDAFIEPLVLDALSMEARDQWISAIMGK